MVMPGMYILQLGTHYLKVRFPTCNNLEELQSFTFSCYWMGLHGGEMGYS